MNIDAGIRKIKEIMKDCDCQPEDLPVFETIIQMLEAMKPSTDLEKTLADMQGRIEKLEGIYKQNISLKYMDSKPEPKEDPKHEWQEKAYKSYKDMIQIQVSDPSSKTDDYIRGMANGMIFIDSCIRGIEPKYMDKPTKSKQEGQTFGDVCKVCGFQKALNYCTDMCHTKDNQVDKDLEERISSYLFMNTSKDYRFLASQIMYLIRKYQSPDMISISRDVAKEWMKYNHKGLIETVNLQKEINKALKESE